jgi:tetratricopeptide (TPR) repeat protein
MTPRPIEDPEPESEPALALAREGQFAQALAWMERAVAAAQEPRDPVATVRSLTRIGRLAEGAGDLESAERALAWALRLKPDYADLNLRYAGILLARHRPAESRRALEHALRVHPRFLTARIELALLDAREGRIGEALAALREVQRDSQIEEPRAFLQGMRCLERADCDEAGAYLRRALHGADPHLDFQLERIGALLDQGEFDGAAHMLRGTLQHFPGYPDLHALLASAELQLGAIDDAIASLARALELNPDFHAARLQLARALDALGERAQALDQVTLVLEQEAGNAQALELQESWSARVHPRSGRKNAARKAA